MTKIIVSFVLVLLVNCAISHKCSEGGSCNLQEHDAVTTIFDISTHTAEPLPQPKALNMLAEDEDDEPTLHSSVPLITVALENVSSTTHPGTASTESPTNLLDEPRGRAINFSLTEKTSVNILNNATSKHDDLSDVSMEDEDETDEMKNMHPKISPKEAKHSTISLGSSCTEGGLTYENGETLEAGCDSLCTCINGKMNCTDRCTGPFFRKGKIIADPLCSAEDVDDPCCSILVCASDTATEPLEVCFYKNKTYKRGEQFEDGCESFCTCEHSGKINCKSRCAPINKTSDRCVEVPDSLDRCCKKILCDVTLDDHEPEKENEDVKYKLLTAKYVNSSAIKLEFDTENISIFPDVEVSENKTSWMLAKVLPGGYVHVSANIQYIKIKATDDILRIHNVPSVKTDSKNNCEYKGRILKMHEEYNDNCTSLCVCREDGIQCLKMDCPTYFGLDVLNPSCIEWDIEPPNFVPSPPDCCPKSVKCKNNGSCEYQGATYNNWQQVPTNVTGCEKRCFCEMGNIECQNVCPLVTAHPPANMECPPHAAMLDHLPDDDCCLYWTCDSSASSQGNVYNDTMEIRQNETLEKDANKSLSDTFLLNNVKTPSKILGPLLVYSNKDSNNNTLSKGDPEVQLIPNISKEENHYYVKKDDSKKHSHSKIESPIQKKPVQAHKDENTPFISPLLPTYPPITSNNKQTKPGSKTKPNKTGNTHYVSPYTEQSTDSVMPHTNQADTPNKQSDITHPNSHIEIHGNGDPDELLQFINQHPELSNYPSGSIFEIHDPPPNQKQGILPQHTNQNSLLTPSNKRPVLPFVIQSPLDHQEDLPQNVNVEHILQHIQKNPFIPFLPNSQTPPNNGQLFITSSNGLVIPNRPQPNFTRPGINDHHLYPGGFINIPPAFQQPQDEINVHTLEATDAHTIRLEFTVPPVIVGLHGRVEVRYTHKENNDPNTWQRQIFAPPNDLIETPQLEFDLLGLKEDTEYRIKITIMLRDLHNTPSSRIYTVRTLKGIPQTTLPPMIPIKPNLMITDINSSWVNVAWRKLTEQELQFVDGVQLRYKEIDGKIYAATPLIHRAVTLYTLENLKENTKYEAGIYFIPFPGQQTELHAEHMIYFTTANEVDNYGFNVTLEISQVKATSVEITWSGVPYPEDKYVNIYRAIYQSDSGKGDFSTFKIAKRESQPKTVIMDLKPGIRYRLWLEVYLTNGKIKTSNVQDFITKPGSVPSLGAATIQGKLEAGDLSENKGDYYGPLVIVAILAAIAILSTLILLLILVKRHSQNKAAITPPQRVSQSAYDNPTYKVEIQQETMDL